MPQFKAVAQADSGESVGRTRHAGTRKRIDGGEGELGFRSPIAADQYTVARASGGSAVEVRRLKIAGEEKQGERVRELGAHCPGKYEVLPLRAP